MPVSRILATVFKGRQDTERGRALQPGRIRLCRMPFSRICADSIGKTGIDPRIRSEGMLVLEVALEQPK
jgi:hypothetical protein